MYNIGGPKLIIVPLTVILLLIAVITLIDLSRRPDAQFVAAGQNRTTWLVLALASVVVPFLCPADLYYLFAIRPKLAARSCRRGAGSWRASARGGRPARRCPASRGW